MKKIEKETALKKVPLAKVESTPGVEVIEHAHVHKVIATDEYAGQGGSYIYNPKTGTRTPNLKAH